MMPKLTPFLWLILTLVLIQFASSLGGQLAAPSGALEPAYFQESPLRVRRPGGVRIVPATPGRPVQEGQRYGFGGLELGSFWSTWTPWSVCQRGLTVRSRGCSKLNGFSCPSVRQQVQHCSSDDADVAFPSGSGDRRQSYNNHHRQLRARFAKFNPVPVAHLYPPARPPGSNNGFSNEDGSSSGAAKATTIYSANGAKPPSRFVGNFKSSQPTRSRTSMTDDGGLGLKLKPQHLRRRVAAKPSFRPGERTRSERLKTTHLLNQQPSQHNFLNAPSMTQNRPVDLSLSTTDDAVSHLSSDAFTARPHSEINQYRRLNPYTYPSSQLHQQQQRSREAEFRSDSARNGKPVAGVSIDTSDDLRGVAAPRALRLRRVRPAALPLAARHLTAQDGDNGRVDSNVTLSATFPRRSQQDRNDLNAIKTVFEAKWPQEFELDNPILKHATSQHELSRNVNGEARLIQSTGFTDVPPINPTFLFDVPSHLPRHLTSNSHAFESSDGKARSDNSLQIWLSQTEAERTGPQGSHKESNNGISSVVRSGEPLNNNAPFNKNTLKPSGIQQLFADGTILSPPNFFKDNARPIATPKRTSTKSGISNRRRWKSPRRRPPHELQPSDVDANNNDATISIELEPYDREFSDNTRSKLHTSKLAGAESESGSEPNYYMSGHK